jgi:hypothetical protein
MQLGQDDFAAGPDVLPDGNEGQPFRHMESASAMEGGDAHAIVHGLPQPAGRQGRTDPPVAGAKTKSPSSGNLAM